MTAILSLFIIILAAAPLQASETTENTPAKASTYDPSKPYFPTIPPRKSEFSDDVNTANSFNNINWLSFTIEERADQVYEMAKTLIDAHDFHYGVHNFSHSPRVLTCKVYKESTFNPQIKSPISSGVGLSQVLDQTAEDLFDRYGSVFHSIVPGFENVRDGKDVPKEKSFHYLMAKSIPAQIELGLFVMQMKAMDIEASGHKITSVRDLLERYYGATKKDRKTGKRVLDHKKNKAYADPIFRCAKCIKRNKNDHITQACLDCAKGLKSCPVK